MFRKPWEDGNRGAYHLLDSWADLAGFKRCRKVQSFILSDEGVEKIAPKCNVCKKTITVKGGNRAEYFPKTKRVRIMHYECAWSSLFADIYGPMYDAVMGR